MPKKRLLTGMQSSGQLHIGNYLGMLKPLVEMHEDYDSYLMVADYHSITSLKEKELVSDSIKNSVKDALAVGIDPDKAVIFKQSDVSEHTELAWILNCQVTVPFLMQAHAYKDKVAKGLEANAGLFTYPMLMAADILLYDAAVVPVGSDQRQHVEYAREAATKFNNNYGETFVMPEEKISDTVGTVPGTDGQKMSKSYKNTIPLFGTKEEVEKAVMSIVTDSEGERPEHVFNIHKLFKSEAELESLYEENKGKYKNLKEALAADIETVVGPMREKRGSISDDDVKAVLAAGAEKAKEVAAVKMKGVKEKIGVSI